MTELKRPKFVVYCDEHEEFHKEGDPINENRECDPSTYYHCYEMDFFLSQIADELEWIKGKMPNHTVKEYQDLSRIIKKLRGDGK